MEERRQARIAEEADYQKIFIHDKPIDEAISVSLLPSTTSPIA